MKRTTTKLIHEGSYAAEVQVELDVTDGPWSPYLALDEAERLDAVRVALRSGDVQTASQYGRVFRLRPVEA